MIFLVCEILRKFDIAVLYAVAELLVISLVSHFQSHQCQPTTSSFQSHQHLEECNIICSQM